MAARETPLMRAPLALAALLILSALPGLASANLSHDPCGTSQLSVGNSVRVDVWAGSCVGVVVWTQLAECLGQDIHAAGTHTLILYDSGCQTGEIVELP
jgi:hypothetical protein